MTINPRLLPRRTVFSPRNNITLNEVSVQSVAAPQDVNECVLGIDECDHYCLDGWFPVMSYTVCLCLLVFLRQCGCYPGFKLGKREVYFNSTMNVTEVDPLRCVPDRCGDGIAVFPPLGNESCDSDDYGCNPLTCTVWPGSALLTLRLRLGSGVAWRTGWTSSIGHAV